MRLLTKPINQMKAIYRLLLLAFFMPAFANAQDEEGPKRNRVELTYIKVKIGHEKNSLRELKSIMPNIIKKARLIMRVFITFEQVRMRVNIFGPWVLILMPI